MTYPDYGLQQESKFAEFIDAVKSFGWLKIFLLLAIVSGVLYFLSQPQPGKVSVTVFELDSRKAIPATELSLYDNEGKPAGKAVFTDDAGQAIFSNVPAGKSLTLKADASSSFKPASRQVTLKSGEAQDVRIDLARQSNVELSVEPRSLVLGSGCSRNLTVTAQNKGETTDVEIIGDGLLKNNLQSPTVRIPKGMQATLFVKATVPAGDALADGEGTLRVKKTDSQTTIKFKTVKPSEADVSPGSIAQEVKPGTEYKQLITITNRGGLEEIADLTATVGGGLAPMADVALADNAPIKPGEKNIATLTIRLPPATTTKTVGWVTISTPCKNYRIETEITPAAAN